MLADLKVVETSSKVDERTVEKIKGVSLVGKESWCICRQHVSEERSQIAGAWESSISLVVFCLLLGALECSKVSFGARRPHEDTV